VKATNGAWTNSQIAVNEFKNRVLNNINQHYLTMFSHTLKT